MLALSCDRQKEVLVPDNTAPPDQTVSDVALESYINRVYISLLGRKPDDAEFAAGTTTLRADNLSQQNRIDFVDDVLARDAFDQHFFDLNFDFLLPATDTSQVAAQIFLFQLLLLNPDYEEEWDIMRDEKERLEGLLAIPTDLQSSAIDHVQALRRMSHNYFYDQINMGTQNFVIAMFQNFLLRYPTDAELEAAEQMVDGFSATVFLETGQSKLDFLDIFFQTADFYEGQVREVFNRLLFRVPDTEEMETNAVAFKNSGDYPALLR
ncbi:MAG: hypothetical protein AAF570_01815, partial [Bacteroidota bacterium]